MITKRNCVHLKYNCISSYNVMIAIQWRFIYLIFTRHSFFQFFYYFLFYHGIVLDFYCVICTDRYDYYCYIILLIQLPWYSQSCYTHEIERQCRRNSVILSPTSQLSCDAHLIVYSMLLRTGRLSLLPISLIYNASRIDVLPCRMRNYSTQSSRIFVKIFLNLLKFCDQFICRQFLWNSYGSISSLWYFQCYRKSYILIFYM